MAEPVADTERQRILELHAGGMSRNDIARETGRSPGTITTIVHAAGGTFDRTGEVAAATAAKQADNRLRRAELEAGLIEDAHKLRAQLWEKALVYSFGGKDNTYAERTIDEPDAAAKAKLMQAVSTAVTASLRIADHDSGAGVDDARSMLTGLAEALGVAWRGQQQNADAPADS